MYEMGLIKLNLVNRVMETSSNDHVVNDSDRSRDSCGQCQESSAAMLVRRLLSKLIETNKMDVIYYFDRAQPQKPHEILVKEQLNRIKKNIQYAKNFQLSKNLIPTMASNSHITPSVYKDIQSVESNNTEETDSSESLEILIESLDQMDILDLLLLMYHDIDHELTNQVIQEKLSKRLNQNHDDSRNDLPKLELESQSPTASVHGPLQSSSLNTSSVKSIDENEFKLSETKPFSHVDSRDDPTQDPGSVPSNDQSVNQYWESTTEWSTRPPSTTSKPLDSREPIELQDDKSE